MLRPTQGTDDLAESARSGHVAAVLDAPRQRRRASRNGTSANDGWAYGQWFWFSYAANTTLMVLVTILFRYSDFVRLLGGTELQLGWIVGAGAVGSLAMRLLQGKGVDRYGPRMIWLASLATVVVTMLAHLAISRPDGAGIYAVRIAYQTGIAGAFGASIAYVSLRAPLLRMAELVGTLGTSGFVGMTIGALLGDLLCAASPLRRTHMDRLFLVAAGLAVLSLLCAATATRGQIRPQHRRRPPILWLLRKYHPGRLLLMGAAMGAGVSLPGTFLRPYTESLGIEEMASFFVTYAATAFVTRLVTRRLPDRLGVRPTVLLGMGCLTASMVLYLVATSPALLVLPAVAAGLAHALLFPSVVAGGSRSFPVRHRGLATAFMLGAFDLGNLLGMPLAGTVVSYAPLVGLPPYATMFLAVAAAVALSSVFFAMGPRSPALGNNRSNGGVPLRNRRSASNPTPASRA